MKKTTTNRLILAVALTAALATLPGQAANTLYAPGDLVLFFQQEGGTNTIYANLGAATGYRGSVSGIEDASTSLNILDLGTTLSTAFGAGWASDPSIYAGLAGVYSTSSIGATITAGDPPRTVYVSQSRATVGIGSQDSTGYTIASGSTGMSNAASGISNMNSTFENNYEGLVAISATGVSLIDNNNPFLAPGLQGNAFNNTFAGGVQQVGTAGNRGNVDGLGNIEFSLDLHRILARTTGTGIVAGPQYDSTLEGTVVVGSNGSVSFLGSTSAVPEPGALALGLIGTVAGLGYRRRRNA